MHPAWDSSRLAEGDTHLAMADSRHPAEADSRPVMVGIEDCMVVDRRVADCSRQAPFLVLAPVGAKMPGRRVACASVPYWSSHAKRVGRRNICATHWRPPCPACSAYAILRCGTL